MVDPRVFILAIPSAFILALLVWHSVHALPRRRAAAFWIAVALYGVLRGLGVRLVTSAIGASFPYEIRNPLLTIWGVSLQEIAGWALVAYLGWWIGARFSHRLFLQVAWASLFLGAISWAIEAAAIAARWWHWTVPTASRVFINVPAIGIVDWFFVGIDFVLPFVAITALRSPWRFASLLTFPAHFAGHLLPGIWLHVVHWSLVVVAAWLAMRSGAEDRPFRWGSALPSIGFAIIVLDVVIVHLLIVKRPELLVSIVPVVALWLIGLRRRGERRPWSRSAAIAAVAAIAAFAVVLHWYSARERSDLTRRLDAAIAARDRGDVSGALYAFEAIARDHPTSYVPLAMAGEIHYRTGRIDEARERLARAVEIKQDFIRGYRLLAVIDRQKGRDSEWAARGLELAPDDLELRYLAGEDVLPDIDSPDTAAGMTALAYEVGDLSGAERILGHGLSRWPAHQRLQAIRRRLRL